jgi:hypothetical protein
VNYTINDIKKYVEGKLSSAEMHAMEKAAMNDPFLADALQGMKLHASDTMQFSADTEALREVLQHRVKGKPKTRFRQVNLWWKAAAVLVLITGASIIIFYTGEKNKVSPVEVAKTENSEHEGRVTDTQTIQKDEEGSLQNIDSPARNVISGKATARLRQPGEKNSTAFPGVSGARKSKGDAIPESEQSEQRLSRADASVSKVSEKREVRSALEEAPVVTADSIRDAGNKDWNLDSLQGRAAGVSVEKAGNRTYRRAESSPSPEGGWDAFNRYIRHSNRIAHDSASPTTVTVSFAVSRRGKLSSIRVLNEVTPAIRDEAIRLVKEGPRWQIPKGSKREVTILFNL